MSRLVNIAKFTEKQIRKLEKDLHLEIPPSRYAPFAKSKFLTLFDQDSQNSNLVYVPFAYSPEIPRPLRESFSVHEYKFELELREEQKEVQMEGIKLLNKFGSCIIAAACGFGKTAIAINIASRIKLKTAIICNRIQLIKQWSESIQKFCPQATYKVIQAKTEATNADFYIINATNVPKHTREFYKDIGFVIVDEAHQILAEKVSTCMRYFCPRYALALSATPYRLDSMNSLFDYYFSKQKIYRKLFREHIVYRVSTEFVPEEKQNASGKIDWGTIIDSLSNNVERNEMIIDLIKRFSDRTILVLCKRISQAKYLVKRLQEEKESVTSLYGKNQSYEQSSRILVGTVSKLGIGFDHARLDTLLLACDVEQYYEQVLGRVFRRKDVKPIVIDIVDQHGILEKHFRTRKREYIDKGGVIEELKN